jgi:hypothetical protein
MRYVLGWVTVTAVVTLAAWQVVGAAQEQVGEVPTAPLVAVSAAPQETSPSDSTGPADSGVPGQSTTSTSNVSGSTPGSTTSTTRPSGQVTTPTSSTTSTTSTTQASLPAGSATIPSPGGTVTVSYSGGEVYLVGAAPANGFAAEVKNQGPDEVRVEFSSDTVKFDVRARWEAGGLVTTVSQEDND